MQMFYDYKYGELEYRSLEFKHDKIEAKFFQSNAVVNYTDEQTPFTRIIEHKYFELPDVPSTVVSKEFPKTWSQGLEPYYPINNKVNQKRLSLYKHLADAEINVIFGGRLAEYKYYDMHQVIASALIKIMLVE